MQQKRGLLVNIPVTSGPWHSKVLTMVAKGFPVPVRIFFVLSSFAVDIHGGAKPIASFCIERDSVYQNV